MNYQPLIFYFMGGLVAITLLDVVGSIASRRFQFNYSALIPFSVVIYITIGYLISKDFEFKRAILVNGFLGLYDGTVGFWFSIKLKANNGLTTEQAAKMMGPPIAIAMIGIAILLAGVGYGIAKAW